MALAGRRSLMLIAIFALAGCASVVPSLTRSTAPPTAAASMVATGRPSGTGTPGSVPADSPPAAQVEAIRSSLRLPTALSRLVAIPIADSILVCGGLLGDGSTTGAIVRLDLVSHRASTVGRLASPVHDAGGAMIGSTAYVVGGGSATAGRTVQAVDAAGRSSVVGSLPVDRADLAAVAIGGTIVVVGGGTPAGPDGQLLETSDGRNFATLGTLRVGVRYPAVAALGGLVYVIGGTTVSGNSDAIQVVDPRSGRVRILGRLPAALSHAAAVVLGGALYLAGGRRAGRAQDALWQIDVTDGVATRMGRLPYAVSDAAPVVVGGTDYLVGGEIGAPIASIIEISLH